jgi:hypothetical protein
MIVWTMLAAAERTAAFLLERVTARWGRLWDQGPRPLPGESAGGPLGVFARRRVRGVPESVAVGLQAWARGQRPIDLTEAIPSAREVLALQAHGRRCVSLLEDAVARAHGDPRHPDGLTFALHDLCHVEKFVSPDHHRGQVGFFRAIGQALAAGPFADLERTFDPLWRSDRDYVIADMNGSAIFLFSVLKMRIKMAVRRQTDPTCEPAAFAAAIAALCAGMSLPSSLRDAAHLVSARRDHPALARRLLAHFEQLGA